MCLTVHCHIVLLEQVIPACSLTVNDNSQLGMGSEDFLFKFKMLICCMYIHKNMCITESVIEIKVYIYVHKNHFFV